ncbi:MAG TPA: sulfotransferase [Anaerolineales bacterium]
MLKSFNKRLAGLARRLSGEPAARRTRKEIPAITAEEVAEVRDFFPMEKYFIFGHARSGTTLLARLVRLHPEVHCNYQAHFFTRPPLLQSLVADPEVETWLTRRSNRWNRGGDLSPVVLRVTADFIMERDARREGKQVVGDKSPSSLLDGEAVRLMHNVYPDGRLVYIVRDGRDTAISHRFQTFIDAPQHLSKEDLQIRDDFARNPEPYMHGERSVFTEKSIHQAAQGWVSNVVETDRMGKEYYGERYFCLRYEDLLKQPWEEMSRLWSFLGVQPEAPGLREAIAAEFHQNPDADWQQQKASDLAQPLQKGKEGSWREMFTPRDRKIFHEIAAATLQAWGYEG